MTKILFAALPRRWQEYETPLRAALTDRKSVV